MPTFKDAHHNQEEEREQKIKASPINNADEDTPNHPICRFDS